MKRWLKFFRIVNLPTVPGDVLVGAASAMTALGSHARMEDVTTLVGAALASCGLYLFGLADNDIVGAKTDTNRPIPDGEISVGAARLARALCLVAVVAIALYAHLPAHWWGVAEALLVAMVVYNRTKRAVLMGVCRGLNVLLGASAFQLVLSGTTPSGSALVGALTPIVLPPLIWTAYIWWVTKVSEGEETDPRRQQMVGLLIGALIYLQLGALLIFALIKPETNRLLLVGAVLLIVLRVVKRLCPRVSAS